MYLQKLWCLVQIVIGTECTTGKIGVKHVKLIDNKRRLSGNIGFPVRQVMGVMDLNRFIGILLVFLNHL